MGKEGDWTEGKDVAWRAAARGAQGRKRGRRAERKEDEGERGGHRGILPSVKIRCPKT